MTFKKMLLVVASAVVPLLAACGATDEATSIIDSATGEPVAINYPTDAKFVDVAEPSSSVQSAVVKVCPIDDPYCVPVDNCPIDDPRYPYCDEPVCDPVYDWGCEPCDRTNPAAWCYCAPGPINSSTTVRVGREPSASLEVNSLAGTSCNRQVVTGIGARIVSDSNYETLHVEYRQPNADGTLGGRYIARSGSNPYGTLEAWASVPDGYAVVGVAAGQQGTHDLRTLIVYYRRVELTASGVRMTGPVYQLNAGVNPYGSVNATYLNTNDANVFVGVGFSSAVEQTKTIAAHVGTFQ
ncbi:hypothetical protein ATI61_104305 [Archangium gephyra]|uniref:Uncharacterized protein n=1 Tax=Archangium gephyra TaxID=48 RepID=A0AAC8TBU1_9BACT|nr:hypothetical protein [Archangium gephyra]AKJ00287.1 Hypothetical protein AA314_01913 [Archangium gephyra]REG33015.1 hypothetical protein ATI61_104305 [Archangium gephyra]